MTELPLRILPNGILEIASSTSPSKSQLVYYAKGTISKYMLTQTPDSEETYFVSIYEKGTVSAFSYQFRCPKGLLPEVHEILQMYMNESENLGQEKQVEEEEERQVEEEDEGQVEEEEEGQVEEEEEGQVEEEDEGKVEEQTEEQQVAEKALIDTPTLIIMLCVINIVFTITKVMNFSPTN
jgi:hypothetical protein